MEKKKKLIINFGYWSTGNKVDNCKKSIIVERYTSVYMKDVAEYIQVNIECG